MQATTSAAPDGTNRRIEIFEYAVSPVPPSLPALEGWGPGAEEEMLPDAVDQRPATDRAGAAREAEMLAGFEKRVGEERSRSFEAGREVGRDEGRQNERGAQAATHAEAERLRVRQTTELFEKFARERDSYLQAVEPEVVQLALAVAARILRREAQMDPLLLTGAVRVALGQLAGSTEVELQVPAADLDLWKEAMRLLPNLAVKPTVTAGEGMRLGDCRIETRLGSVDLGIRSQMGEIEKGFFDRAGPHRPDAALTAELPAPSSASYAADNLAIRGQNTGGEAHP